MNFIFQLTFDLETAHRKFFSICAIRVICEPLISLADLANPADFLPTDVVNCELSFELARLQSAAAQVTA